METSQLRNGLLLTLAEYRQNNAHIPFGNVASDLCMSSKSNSEDHIGRHLPSYQAVYFRRTQSDISHRSTPRGREQR